MLQIVINFQLVCNLFPTFFTMYFNSYKIEFNENLGDYNLSNGLFKLLQTKKDLWVQLIKTYDCIPLDLLIAKLKCYRTENFITLSLILDYFSRHIQRTKMCSNIVRGRIQLEVFLKVSFWEPYFWNLL